MERSLETKMKISMSKMGHIVSKETRIKLSVANTGKKLSEETRKKISKKLTGIRRSKETRERMSVAQKMRVIKSPPAPRVSIGEKEVVNFIKMIYKGPILENDYSALLVRELDVYLPELNLAFEYNGEYWHSFEDRKEIDAWKRRECRKRKIALLDIWEKDWMERPDYIKGFISALINDEQLDSFVHP